MLSKELSKLDFSQPAAKIHNQIRGLSSWPAAYLMLGGKRLKVYRSRLAEEYGGQPGVLLDNKRFIVGCGDGKAIELTEVQAEGSKKMPAIDFLRGKQLPIGFDFRQQ